MQIYRYGEIVDLKAPLTAEDVSAVVQEGRQRARELQTLSLGAIVDVLDRVGSAWSRPDYPLRKLALAELPARIKFSAPMVEQGILTMADLLKRENLETRLACDLGDAAYLDGWVYHTRFGGHYLAQPLGVVAHVSAGNVFVGGVDTLIQGILTKNASILKMSTADPLFPVLFARSVKEHDRAGTVARSMALLLWPGGDEALERVIKQGCDAVVVYGGAETVRSYRKELGLHTRLIEYGPKYSFVLAAADELKQTGFDAAARRIARDVVMWEQSACSSPHAVYVENPAGSGLVDELAGALGKALAQWATELPPGDLTPDEATEITRVREMAKVEQALGKAELLAPKGTEWTVVVQNRQEFQTSCLNRTIFVKPVLKLEDALEAVAPMGAYLQTVAILADAERAKALGQALVRIGADRMVQAGRMAVRKHGTPHDGERGLAQLVRWASLDTGSGAGGPVPLKTEVPLPPPDTQPPTPAPTTDFDFLPDAERDAASLRRLKGIIAFARARSPYYASRLGSTPIGSFEDLTKLPILSGEDLKEHVPPNGKGLLTEDNPAGFVFSSGGTTGRPKVVYRTFEEQVYNAERLGKGLALSVFGPGDVVANLLFAGSLWASFVSYNQALQYTGCRVLPIGGNLDMTAIANYLQLFKANAAITIPSVLLSLAEHVQKNHLKDIRLRKVSTGGEHLYEGAKDFVRRALGVEQFASTGYTSNDTGAIAYQCPHCEGSVHHVHEDLHYVEILDAETLAPVSGESPGTIILTNLQRTLMPTIRYNIGDTGRWVTRPCRCGRKTRLMELLGRCDEVLVIGGGKILPELLASAVHATAGLAEHCQAVARLSGHLDQLLVRVEKKEGTKVRDEAIVKSLKDRLYRDSKELRTMRDQGLIADVAVEILPPGGLPRNARTGKIRIVVDERHV